MREVNEAYIDGLLTQLTPEEKIGMVHGAAIFHTQGVERLFIPPLVTSDGPSGVRYDFYDDRWIQIDQNYDHVSYLPSNSAVAASFSRDCARATGEVLGAEARGRGKDVILSPGMNLKRTPLCGRNFEYFSEDPYLVTELAVPMVEGIQENDVASCIKHFVANNQENGRQHMDTIVGERALRELYYPAFLACIKKAKAGAVMGAYNRLHGTFCCTSQALLDDVLRGEWGFDGVVISDWGGVHDTDEAVRCSLDVEMDVMCDFDRYYLADPLKEAIAEGRCDTHVVDAKVKNILRLLARLGMIGEDESVLSRKKGAYNTPEHQAKCKKTAQESIVLLKNEDSLLPLDGTKYKKIAVIGENAVRLHSNGGGSAEIKALYEICPLMGIMKELGGNAKVTYAQGYYVEEAMPDVIINWQADSTQELVEEEVPKEVLAEQERVREEEQKRLREEAIALAKASDLVIYVGGLNHDQDREGHDRTTLSLPYAQDALIEELLLVCPDTVLTFVGGSPVAMPWLDRTRAVVWSYYPGMEGGTALADVLFGNVNPSGHLPETFLRDAAQNGPIANGDFGNPELAVYREGVMVGYRRYDTDQTDVLFPFGYGLSYTEFAYELVAVEVKEEDVLQVEVKAQVTNTGAVAGSAVAQLYVKAVEPSMERPLHELKGFEKVFLAPGESRQLRFVLGSSAFDYYDESAGCFVTDPGRYRIELAAHSRDIRGEREIVIAKSHVRGKAFLEEIKEKPAEFE